MNKVSEDEQMVSQAYQSFKVISENVMPPADVDSYIQKKASDAIAADNIKKRNRIFIPLSAAASLLIVVGVVLNVAVFNNQSSDQAVSASVHKQPMFMLQRSKPVSADEYVTDINAFLEQGNIEQARMMYKKFVYHYPQHEKRDFLYEQLK